MVQKVVVNLASNKNHFFYKRQIFFAVLVNVCIFVRYCTLLLLVQCCVIE